MSSVRVRICSVVVMDISLLVVSRMRKDSEQLLPVKPIHMDLTLIVTHGVWKCAQRNNIVLQIYISYTVYSISYELRNLIINKKIIFMATFKVRTKKTLKNFDVGSFPQEKCVLISMCLNHARVKMKARNICKIHQQYKDQESQLPAQIFAAKQREVSTHLVKSLFYQNQNNDLT